MIARIKTHLPPFLIAPLRLCKRYFSTPRARNDYATHVPILIGLARSHRIRAVLEFGCGYYSTLTFLNRSAFPHLERLQSVENDATWAETIQQSVKDDRWVLNLLSGEIADSVTDLDLDAFDLILIDDSESSAQRVSTIRAIAKRQPQRPLIVVHDFEVKDYQNAASGLGKRYVFKAYNPHTALVCQRRAGGEIRLMSRLLKEKSKQLEPDDVKGWMSAFRNS